jgi:hypothetical protein
MGASTQPSHYGDCSSCQIGRCCRKCPPWTDQSRRAGSSTLAACVDSHAQVWRSTRYDLLSMCSTLREICAEEAEAPANARVAKGFGLRPEPPRRVEDSSVKAPSSDLSSACPSAAHVSLSIETNDGATTFCQARHHISRTGGGADGTRDGVLCDGSGLAASASTPVPRAERRGASAPAQWAVHSRLSDHCSL